MNKAQIKLAGLGVGILIALTVLLNAFTIVPVGEEAAVSSFGKVHKGKQLQGFNFVLPWWDIDTYKLQHETFTFNDLGIASQDKFKTDMDVAITGSFLPNTADVTRKNTGTSSNFLKTHVEKRVLSCITKAGGEVENSQAFFDKTIQDSLGKSTLNCVNDYLLTVGGYELSAVQFSDIRLDPIVKQFMVKTKQRQEAENQQQSELAIADLKAQELTKVSAAQLLASVDNREAAKNVSDAKEYDMKAEAKGNIALSRSLSNGLVNYIEAKRWDGKRSTHVLGSDTIMMIQ